MWFERCDCVRALKKKKRGERENEEKSVFF